MIIANFTDGYSTATAPGLYQWDYGQILEIHGLSLPPAVEVHFAIVQSTDDAKTRIGTTIDKVTKVAIPEFIVEQSGDAVAYIYISDTTSGKTVKKINMPITARQKPEAFDAPEDAQLFREAIEAVNAATDRAEDAEKSSEAWVHGHEDYPDRDEDNAKYYAVQSEKSAGASETAKDLVMQMGQEVSENKEYVDKKIDDFDVLHKQAIEDINNAGSGQIESINAAGQNAIENIGSGIDSTLSEEGKAADAKATGDEFSKLKGDLDNVVNTINLKQTSLFTEFESGTFYNTSPNNPYLKYDVSPYDKTRKRTKELNCSVNDFSIKVSDGYSILVLEVNDGIIVNSSGYVNKFSGVSNKKYGLIIKSNSDDDISTLDVSTVITVKENNAIKNSIDKLNIELFGGSSDEDIIWHDSKSILVVDLISGGHQYFIGDIADEIDYYKASDYINVYGHEILNLTMPHTSLETPVNIGMAFYDENKNALRGFSVSLPYRRKADESKVKIVKIYIPKEAKYFRTTYWHDSYFNEIPFSYSFSKYMDADKPFTHELPINEEMLNTIKRARQLTDIKWTPLVDVPRYCLIDGDYSGQSDTHFLDWCKTDNEYKGIPYSGSGENDINTGAINKDTLCGRWGYYKFHVGIDIDFETFVTACRYPNSIFGERSQMTHYSFDSSPYGTYCSALVAYALGFKQPLWLVANFCKKTREDRTTGEDFFSEIGSALSNVESNEIRLCDILWNTWHIAIITDIIRDSSGNITHIEVSEATTVGNANNSIKNKKLGGLARRKTWNIDDFYSWFRLYGLYRFKSFYGIEYKKSPYVSVGDETDCMPIVDMPLIPYMGNKFRYKVGHIVNTKILIGATGFTHVVIEKDGSEFNRIEISDKNYVDGGFSQVGSYSAYLTDGTNRTKSCNWTVESD